MIRRERESIIFQPVREGFSSEYAFLARLSHFSVSLTSPSGRKYIANVVKLGDSPVGAGIRPAAEKANSYPSDHWCEKGHILLCLEGELHTELKDGRKFVLKPGQSYQVADTAEPHCSFTELHTPTTQIGVDKV